MLVRHCPEKIGSADDRSRFTFIRFVEDGFVKEIGPPLECIDADLRYHTTSDEDCEGDGGHTM